MMEECSRVPGLRDVEMELEDYGKANSSFEEDGSMTSLF
jgi:hypothetical protein